MKGIGRVRNQMVNPIFLVVALIGTSIATYTDLKTKLVPDWASYFMLAVGLGGHVLVSAIEQSFTPIIFSAVGAAAFFCIGYLLYIVGVWGGGDTKLLAAFGALFGSAGAIGPWPFLVSFWLNLLLVGAALGVLGMLIIFARNRQKVMPQLNQDIQKSKFIFYPLLTLGIATAAISVINTLYILLLALCLLGLLIFVFRATEKVALYRKIRPQKLVEGDWIQDNIVIGNYKYQPKKIGVTKNDIAKLVELEKDGKLDEVNVKDGLPYVPAFLAALIISVFYGDIFYKIMTTLFMAAGA